MMGNGGMFFSGGFMWIFWVLVIIGFVVLIKSMQGNNSQSNEVNSERPLEILKRRYAQGKIDELEFKQRRKELEG